MLFRGAKDLRGLELISSNGKIVLKALLVLIAPILQLVRPKMTINNLGGDSVFGTEWQSISQSERFQKLRSVQNGQVHCFDGSAHFNRPGPRLVDTLERVASLVDQWRQNHD